MTEPLPPLRTDIYNFNGTCKCASPSLNFSVSGARIAKDLVDNRIKADASWMVEPWTGPPYDVKASYEAICTRLLSRLACPANHSVVDPVAYTCACGSFTFGSTRVQELIVDVITGAQLAEMPVFANPITWSIELSIALVLVIGKLFSVAAAFLYLPPVIGFLLAGMAIQDVLNVGVLKGCGGSGPHATPAGEIKTAVLVVVLIRAGLALKVGDDEDRFVSHCGAKPSSTHGQNTNSPKRWRRRASRPWRWPPCPTSPSSSSWRRWPSPAWAGGPSGRPPCWRPSSRPSPRRL